MNKFETLLLKNGNPELIEAYLNEYKEFIGDDFRKAVVKYGQEINLKFSRVYPDKTDILKMDISLLLQNYCSGNVVRIYNTLRYHQVMTVEDLIKCRKETLTQTRNFGHKSMANLCSALAKVGLKLHD